MTQNLQTEKKRQDKEEERRDPPLHSAPASLVMGEASGGGNVSDEMSNPPPARTSSPYVPAPLSQYELRIAIAARTKALFERAGTKYQELIGDHVDGLGHWIKDRVEAYYPIYNILNMLEIFDVQAEKWIELNPPEVLASRLTAPLKVTMVVSDFLFRWFGEALEKKSDAYWREEWIPNKALDSLRSCEGYPFDEKLDRALMRRAAERFPEIDIIMQVEKKVLWWREHPGALRAAKSPRAQLWQWFELETEFLKKGQKG